jgi:hypothetical protein
MRAGASILRKTVAANTTSSGSDRHRSGGALVNAARRGTRFERAMEASDVQWLTDACAANSSIPDWTLTSRAEPLSQPAGLRA